MSAVSDECSIVLPEPVRARVVALASETVGLLPPDEVPPTLRAVARFTPNKRRRLAGTLLAAALETQPDFRGRVVEHARDVLPEVSEAVEGGRSLPAADPIEVAAISYLIRSDGWVEDVDRAREAVRERADEESTRERDQIVERLHGETTHARDRVRQARDEAAAARAEADALRRHVRSLTGQMRRAERERDEALAATEADRQRSESAEADTAAELRRLRGRVEELSRAADAARRSARAARDADDARLWLLVETLSGAARGLREELGLRPTDRRPADDVAAGGPQTGASYDGGPVDLDRLLSLPRVHLVVDGYNVTKTGYGDLPLDSQRDRLTRGLGGIAARTGAEVTCVFDGAKRPPVMPPAPRGVRVLFSDPGVLADDVIARLVAAEPSGRPVVVVSSDGEVAAAARRSGGYPVPAAVLVRRLDRG